MGFQGAKRPAADLREHADSVVILCTMSEGGDSQLISQHKSNVYAVRGTVGTCFVGSESIAFFIDHDSRSTMAKCQKYEDMWRFR